MNNENTGNNQAAAGSPGAVGGSSGGALPPDDEEDPVKWVIENLPGSKGKNGRNVKQAENEGHLEDLYDALTKNRIGEETAKMGNGTPRLSSMLRDGTEVFWRLTSSRGGGETVNIMLKEAIRGFKEWKIHLPKK